MTDDAMRALPAYPMVQCLNGTHPPYNIEEHPDGCPVHLAALSAPAGLDVLRDSAADIAGRAEEYPGDVPKGVAMSWAGTLRSALARSQEPWRAASKQMLADGTVDEGAGE